MAVFHTGTALNTAKPFNRPCFFRTVHRNCAGGAFFRAKPAEYAGVNINRNVASRALRILPWLLRIWPGNGFGAKIMQNCFGKIHHIHMFRYLSVQLMHGSMVKIRIGTSASWQPLSVSIMPGRFANVGVRTRIRSKNLVPFAFT